MTTIDLAKLGIRKWGDIKAQYNKADILLGNGFSINVSSTLHYNSLFGEFLKQCTPDEANFFKHFKTTNFESIMDKLTGARTINDYFGLSTVEIVAAIDKLKEGLVKAIEVLHPRHTALDSLRLHKLSEEFDQFNDVFTLNYDALLYHIIMITLDRHNKDSSILLFSDYYSRGNSTDYREFVEYPKSARYKYVYYLHGALFIFHRKADHLKLMRSHSRELIDCVADQIHNGDFPLCVSEGSPEQKETQISRSSYLSFALRNLDNSRNPLVIYGAALGSQDQHIINTITTTSTSPYAHRRRLAISIYCGGKTPADMLLEIATMQKHFQGHVIDFFDSSTLFAP